MGWLRSPSDLGGGRKENLCWFGEFVSKNHTLAVCQLVTNCQVLSDLVQSVAGENNTEALIAKGHKAACHRRNMKKLCNTKLLNKSSTLSGQKLHPCCAYV